MVQNQSFNFKNNYQNLWFYTLVTYQILYFQEAPHFREGLILFKVGFTCLLYIKLFDLLFFTLPWQTYHLMLFLLQIWTIKHYFNFKAKEMSQKDECSYIYIYKNYFKKCMEKLPCLQVFIPSLFAASMWKRRYSLMVVPLPVLFHFQTCPVYKTFLFIHLPCSHSPFVYLIYGELCFQDAVDFPDCLGLILIQKFD